MKIKHSTPYAPLRAAAYPPVGEQLDAIMKMAQALKAQGISLPAEAYTWIDQCEQVKARFKKPSG